MKIREICDKLNLKVICGDTDAPVEGVYIGDLLSRAMSHVEAGNLWITIMQNVNVIAVATLTEPSAVLLAEDVELCEDVITAAKDNGITVLSSPLTAWELCQALVGLGIGE